MRKVSILTFSSILLLKIILEYNYINFVHPIFLYSGFTLNISIQKAVESYFLVGLILLILVYLTEKYIGASKIVLYIFFIFIYIPFSSLFWLQDNPRIFLYVITFSLIFIIIFVSKTPSIKIPAIKKGRFLFFSIIILCTFLVYGVLILEGGLSRFNLNLLEVYDTRVEYTSTSSWRFMGYLIPWQAYVVNISVIAISLYKKNYNLLFLFIGLQIFLFSMTNFKSFLFSPLVIIFLYLFSKSYIKNNYLFLISVGSTLLIIIVTFLAKITDSILWASIFVRRLFFIPANLQNTYFEYFSNNDKFYLSHSILSFVLDSNNSSPVKEVSEKVFNQSSGANVGFFGDAYANFGLIGIILFSVLLGLLLKLIDSVSSELPSFLSIGIIFIPFMSMVNSAFFTSLLTHGILFSLIVLWLSNSMFEEKRNIEKVI